MYYRTLLVACSWYAVRVRVPVGTGPSTRPNACLAIFILFGTALLVLVLGAAVVILYLYGTCILSITRTVHVCNASMTGRCFLKYGN